jgi:ketosteroid isomerase-like protein
MSAAVQDLAARYGAAWAGHDLDAIMAMHTDDTVYHLHGGGAPAVGQAATRAALSAAMTQWPDLHFERKRVHFGEGHFVSEYEMSASKDGQRIVCDGVDVFTVEGGRVARKDTYLDWAAIQAQLRALESAPSQTEP